MKYCTKCGAEIMDEAVVCVHCGCSTGYTQQNVEKDNAMQIVVKIFMILGCISSGWALIPLAWTIPMTVHAFGKMKNGEKLSTGFKVCTLLFVNLIAGICMLCSDDI